VPRVYSNYRFKTITKIQLSEKKAIIGIPVSMHQSIIAGTETVERQAAKAVVKRAIARTW